MEARTGRRCWAQALGGRVAGSPNLAAAGGRRLVLVGSYDACLGALDERDGTPVWAIEAEDYTHGTPAVAGEVAVAGSCDGRVYVVALSNGAVVARVEAGSHVPNSPAADTNLSVVRTYEGEMVAIEPRGGAIVWRTTLPGSAPIFSSAALTADRLVVGTRCGWLSALRRQDGAVAWEFRARDAIDASPVAAGGVVWVGSDDGRLYAVSLSDGRLLWEHEVGAAIPGSPAVAGDWLVVADADGVVHGFRRRP